MNFTAETDAKFDNFLEISKSEKRLVRIAAKNYDKTGSYFFLKVFKRNDSGDFIINQRLTLTAVEFDSLLAKTEEIRALKKTK